jgi:hypothetical protein
MSSIKKECGQFYTKNYEYILSGLEIPDQCNIIEPFAGESDLADYCLRFNPISLRCYDLHPKNTFTFKRNVLLNPPDYTTSWVVTNPPYLARNKNTDKSIYERYNENDLYKCFLKTILDCLGGILIVPVGFFFSKDCCIRNTFMERFQITVIKYFEEQVFDDSSISVVAFSFVKSGSKLTKQLVQWVRYPDECTSTFVMDQSLDWIIGGEIFQLHVSPHIKVKRFTVGYSFEPDEHLTCLTLNCIDSKREHSICLQYIKGHCFQGTASSRTYATIILNRKLDEQQQIDLAQRFNDYLCGARDKYWSLFLPQYREYGRKRIPFDLCYLLINYLLGE